MSTSNQTYKELAISCFSESFGTVNFNERYTDLHVLGFREVMEEAGNAFALLNAFYKGITHKV